MCLKYFCLSLVNRVLRLTLYELFLMVTVLILLCAFVIWTTDDGPLNIDGLIETQMLQETIDDSGCEIDGNLKIQTENPAIVWWTKGQRPTSETQECSNGLKCDIFSYEDRRKPANIGAYLFYASSINFNHLPLPRPPEIIWGLAHEESPRNVLELLHEKILNLFNYSATFSRYSEVPYPLQHLESLEGIKSKKYFIETSEKNYLLNELAPIMYLQTDCDTSTDRDAYVKELMEFLRIDSYGACLNNKQLPKSLTDDYLNKLYDEEILTFIARYKFIIAIENGVCEDYVTEKFWRAIKVGTVPIYFGSPSIRDWLPNKNSAILLEDFPTPKILSEHIDLLMRDDKLYDKYLEHKINGTISNDKLINELKLRPYQTEAIEINKEFECFICKKLHDGKLKSVNIVNKSHYNCPKPISALTLKELDPDHVWMRMWESSKHSAESIYRRVVNETTPCKT